MAEPTAAERLEQIEQRASAATPGPWAADGPHEACGEIWVCSEHLPADQNVICTGLDDYPQDAAFIAHAREDIPFLLARIRDLEREVAELREDLDEAKTDYRVLLDELGGVWPR